MTAYELFETDLKALISQMLEIESRSLQLSELFESAIQKDEAFLKLKDEMGATQSTALSKANVETSYKMVFNLTQFFQGKANRLGEYNTLINGLLFAATPAEAPISRALESYGEQVVTLFIEIKEMNVKVESLNKLYLKTQINEIVSHVVLDFLPFTQVPKNLIKRAMSMYQAWILIMSASGEIKPSDYSSSLAQWRAFL